MEAKIQYDGNDGSMNLDLNGLSNLNLEDNGAYYIRVPANVDLACDFDLDFYSPDGSACSYTFTHPGGTVLINYDIPYTSMSGGCDFSNIGAFEITADPSVKSDAEVYTINIMGPPLSNTPTPTRSSTPTDTATSTFTMTYSNTPTSSLTSTPTESTTTTASVSNTPTPSNTLLLTQLLILPLPVLHQLELELQPHLSLLLQQKHNLQHQVSLLLSLQQLPIHQHLQELKQTQILQHQVILQQELLQQQTRIL